MELDYESEYFDRREQVEKTDQVKRFARDCWCRCWLVATATTAATAVLRDMDVCLIRWDRAWRAKRRSEGMGWSDESRDADSEHIPPNLHICGSRVLRVQL